MSIKQGSIDVVDRYYGSELVERAYEGSVLVFDAYTEVSGTPPLSYDARVTHVLKNYRLYGTSGGSGALRQNLFDKTTVTTGYVIGSDGEYYENAGGGYSALIDVSEGTYTLGGVSTAHDTYTLRVHGYDGNGDWVEQIYSESITSSTAASYSFTVPAWTAKLRLSVLITNGQDLDNLAMVPGDAYPSYRIPITITAKNLYDKNAKDTSKGYQADRRIVANTGATYASTNNFISEYIPVEPNTVYTLDGIEVVAGATVANPGCCFYDENKDFIATAGCGYSRRSAAWVASDKQVTSPEGAAYIRINISYDTADTAMLLRADHAPAAYIPHDIDYDLFIGRTKLGADEYLDYSEQKVYKMVSGVLTPTDPPSPFPAITAYEGENTLSSTESVASAMVKGRISEHTT